MFFEVRKMVRYLCVLVDYLDKVWRSCKIVLILIVCGCMIVVGEVVIVSWCCFVIFDCRNSIGVCVDLGVRYIEFIFNLLLI